MFCWSKLGPLMPRDPTPTNPSIQNASFLAFTDLVCQEGLADEDLEIH